MIKRLFTNDPKLPIIKNLIVHHSAGSECENWKESRVKESISKIGYNRGYKKWGFDKTTGSQKAWNCSKCNTVNYMGSIKCSSCGKIKTCEPLKFISFSPLKDPDTKLPTFSMYHFVVYKYNLDNNKYGYKFVNMISRPLLHDSGSTLNSSVNQVSIALCFLGDYRYRGINKKALDCVADNLGWIVDYTHKKLKIIGHKDVQQTECPGLIYNQLSVLRVLLDV